MRLFHWSLGVKNKNPKNGSNMGPLRRRKKKKSRFHIKQAIFTFNLICRSQSCTSTCTGQSEIQARFHFHSFWHKTCTSAQMCKSPKCTLKPEGWESSVSVLKWIQTRNWLPQVIMSQVNTKAESLFQQRNLRRALWKAWMGTQTECRLYPWCVPLAWSRYLQRSHHGDTEQLLVLHPAPLQPSLTVMWLAAGPDKAG